MNIKGSRILVLGGWGLVGVAVCKKLLAAKPAYLVLVIVARSRSFRCSS